MVTRKALTTLAILTLIGFAVAGILGNHRHGFLKVIADVSWTVFIFGLVLLVIGSVVALVRSRKRDLGPTAS